MTSMYKILGSIEREVRALASDVNEMASYLRTTCPELSLEIRRSPERVILQAGEVGVSVSWFRSRAGENAGVELVIAEWDGEITFPGATARQGRHATQVAEQRFHIIPGEGESWAWVNGDATRPITSHALATHCVEVLTNRCVLPGQLNPSEVLTKRSVSPGELTPSAVQ